MTTNFPALKEAEGKLEAKRKEASSIFAEAGPDLDFTKVKSISGVNEPKGVIEHLNAINTECEDLQKEVNKLKGVAKAYEFSQHKPEATESSFDGTGLKQLSLGQMFMKSDAYTKKVYKGTGAEARLDVDLKTVMSTGAGYAPQAVRTDVVVPSAQRPVQITDVIPALTTDQVAVVFMEETTFTNNAAEVAESVEGTPGTYGEAALVFTQRTSNVQKIAVWLPVTDEQLEDITGLPQYLDSRLPFMIRQRLDGQIMSGSGTAPNLRGLVNISGILTQAKGADASPDAILKGIVKSRVTGRAVPNYLLVHSTDWQNIRLLKDANGNDIWGSPASFGPETIWGLPVVQTETGSAGTLVVIDTQYLALYTKRGLDVQVSNSHSTFFVEGKQAVRADVRVAFVCYRPATICTVTGL